MGFPVALCVQWPGPRGPTFHLFYPGGDGKEQEGWKTLAYIGCQSQELGFLVPGPDPCP